MLKITKKNNELSQIDYLISCEQELIDILKILVLDYNEHQSENFIDSISFLNIDKSLSLNSFDYKLEISSRHEVKENSLVYLSKENFVLQINNIIDIIIKEENNTFKSEDFYLNIRKEILNILNVELQRKRN